MADDKISKLISYWLRHNPTDAGLTANEYGWVDIAPLLAELQRRRLSITLPDLLILNQSFDKVRWEFDETHQQMRATHGHSFPVLLSDKAAVPPAILYHGTAVKSIERIQNQGLQPMGRQFVHLSENTTTAIETAKRHGKPVLITISTQQLLDAGWIFYQTSDNVWLTTAIPPQYLSFDL